MKLLEDFDEEALGKRLDEQMEVIALKLVPLILAFGVMAFALVVTVLYFMRDEGEASGTSDTSMVGILSMVHGLLFVATFATGTIFFKIMLSPARIEAGLGSTMHTRGAAIDDPSAKFLMLYRQAVIIRLALLESAALFGLVICLLAVLGGEMRQQPLLALNAASALFMILYVVITLPTKPRLMETVRHLKEMARLRGTSGL